MTIIWWVLCLNFVFFFLSSCNFYSLEFDYGKSTLFLWRLKRACKNRIEELCCDEYSIDILKLIDKYNGFFKTPKASRLRNQISIKSNSKFTSLHYLFGYLDTFAINYCEEVTLISPAQGRVGREQYLVCSRKERLMDKFLDELERKQNRPITCQTSEVDLRGFPQRQLRGLFFRDLFRCFKYRWTGDAKLNTYDNLNKISIFHCIFHQLNCKYENDVHYMSKYYCYLYYYTRKRRLHFRIKKSNINYVTRKSQNRHGQCKEFPQTIFINTTLKLKNSLHYRICRLKPKIISFFFDKTMGNLNLSPIAFLEDSGKIYFQKINFKKAKIPYRNHIILSLSTKRQFSEFFFLHEPYVFSNILKCKKQPKTIFKKFTLSSRPKLKNKIGNLGCYIFWKLNIFQKYPLFRGRSFITCKYLSISSLHLDKQTTVKALFVYFNQNGIYIINWKLKEKILKEKILAKKSRRKLYYERIKYWKILYYIQYQADILQKNAEGRSLKHLTWQLPKVSKIEFNSIIFSRKKTSKRYNFSKNSRKSLVLSILILTLDVELKFPKRKKSIRFRTCLLYCDSCNPKTKISIEKRWLLFISTPLYSLLKRNYFLFSTLEIGWIEFRPENDVRISLKIFSFLTNKLSFREVSRTIKNVKHKYYLNLKRSFCLKLPKGPGFRSLVMVNKNGCQRIHLFLGSSERKNLFKTSRHKCVFKNFLKIYNLNCSQFLFFIDKSIKFKICMRPSAHESPRNLLQGGSFGKSAIPFRNIHFEALFRQTSPKSQEYESKHDWKVYISNAFLNKWILNPAVFFSNSKYSALNSPGTEKREKKQKRGEYCKKYIKKKKDFHGKYLKYYRECVKKMGAYGNLHAAEYTHIKNNQSPIFSSLNFPTATLNLRQLSIAQRWVKSKMNPVDTIRIETDLKTRLGESALFLVTPLWKDGVLPERGTWRGRSVIELAHVCTGNDLILKLNLQNRKKTLNGKMDSFYRRGVIKKKLFPGTIWHQNGKNRNLMMEAKLLRKISCGSVACITKPKSKIASWFQINQDILEKKNMKERSNISLMSFGNESLDSVLLPNLINYSTKETTFIPQAFTASHVQLSNLHPLNPLLRTLHPSRDKKQAYHMRMKRGMEAMTSIPILGLFDLTCDSNEHIGGHSERAAAQLAIKHINRMKLIPRHRLRMFVNDTQCDTGVAVDTFFHAIYTRRVRILLLLGAACPDVTESLAQVTPYWNLVQIAFGSETPALSDRSSFPLFFRTVAPDSSHNPARVAFLKHFNWHTVATLSESNNLYTLALNELVLPLETANISLVATVTMDAQDNLGEHLKALKDRDCRIFIGSFSPPLIRLLFCQIYRLQMYGRDYAWLLSGSFQNRWWMESKDVNCSRSQMLQAAQGSFLITAHSFSVGNETSLSGMTSREFVKVFTQTGYPLTQYVTHTYDAVWAGALALKKIVQRLNAGPDSHEPMPTHVPNWGHWAVRKNLGSFLRNQNLENRPEDGATKASQPSHQGQPNSTHVKKGLQKASLLQSDYNDAEVTSQLLYELQHLQFYGVSGPVSFDKTDRIGVTAFYQVQDGETKMVALYFPRTKYLDFYCPRCSSITWPGGQVPIASRVFMTRILTVHPMAFVIMSLLAILGIILALIFLAFNLIYRRLKFIKMSSPHLNNITVVGCIFVYTAVLLLGLDYATLTSSEILPLICTGRAFLLSAGFSLSFGSMFTKTYRVHQIFTRSNTAGLVRNKLLQDTQLISLVAGLLVADVILVSAWASVDPMKRELLNLTLEISPLERGVVYQPQIEVCRSLYQKEWLGALYVYKGLLIAVGAYMAWETRHVKIQVLNDSQYIGMSVYNVVITSVIIITTAYIIQEKITLSYVIVTTLIISSTTTTLCLLFIPKILALSKATDVDLVGESMGLRVQSKTRRFIMDDQREHFHRAEIRNRVYRRELIQMDAQIVSLTRKLENLDNYPGSNSLTGSILAKSIMLKEPTSLIKMGRRRESSFSEEQEKIINFNKVIKRATKTNYLQGDDAVIRRAKRAFQMRLLHRSLPSLVTSIRGEEKEDSQNKYDFWKELNGNELPLPPSPHPLQRARVHRRSTPECVSEVDQEEKHNLQLESKQKNHGILDLTYTLNFSTPILHELPFSVSSRTAPRPRVSFSDIPTTYSPPKFLPMTSNSLPSGADYSSSSSSSINLSVLPPYPYSSMSSFEESGDNGEGLFVVRPPAHIGSRLTPEVHRRREKRSSSQPSMASAFCSFLRAKSKGKKRQQGTDEVASDETTHLSLLSVTRSSSLLVIPSVPLVTNSEGNSKDLRLSFDCISEKEISPTSLTEYKVTDLELLCPMAFKKSFLSPF